MIRVKISLTYRAVPYCVELEGSDKTDVNFLLTEALASVIEGVQRLLMIISNAKESDFLAKDMGKIKLVFSAKGVTVVKRVSFGIFGVVDSHIEYAYKELPFFFGQENPLTVTEIAPIIENGKLILIELSIQDNNTKITDEKIGKKRKNTHFRSKKSVGKLKVVGIVKTSRTKKEYAVLRSKANVLYIKSEFGKHHIRRCISERRFEQLMSWLRKQDLPCSYRKLELKMRQGEMADYGTFWDFTIIAMAKNLIKSHFHPKKQETTFYFV